MLVLVYQQVFYVVDVSFNILKYFKIDFSFLNDEGKLNFSLSKHFIRNSLKSIGNGMMLFGGFSMLYTLSKYGIMYARQKSGFVNNLGGLIVAGIPFYRSTFMRRGFIFVAGLVLYDVVTDFAMLFRK